MSQSDTQPIEPTLIDQIVDYFRTHQGREFFRENTEKWDKCPDNLHIIFNEDLVDATEAVQDLYHEFEREVESSTYPVKGTYETALLQPIESGPILYKNPQLYGRTLDIHSFQNKIFQFIHPNPDGKRVYITTSYILMGKRPTEGKPGWAITKSGSVYKWY